jgi:Phage integrase family
VGISKLKVAARQNYATDKDFNFLLQVAKESGFWYLPFVMMIAYQARMRLAEVLDLTDAAELPDGLYIARRKGSKDNIMLWTDNIKAAWDAAKAKRTTILAKRKMPQQIDPKRRYIFISERTGDRITTSAFETAKKRIDAIAKEKAEQLGIDYTHFTFHDLKRKACSDFEGNIYDKMQASGHRSVDIMKVYDVNKAKVKATTDD